MEYLPLILFIISTSVTPGPNNALIMASGANHGIHKSLPHLLGIEFGFPVMLVAVGFGAGRLFEQFPFLQIILKTIGSLYLVYLAYKVASAPVDPLATENKKPFTFIQAALFQWINPKAWIMAVSAVVTFTNASGQYFLQVMTIAVLFIIFGFPCTGVWLLSGVTLRRWLANPICLRAFNIVMALLLLASLLPVARELFTGYAS